MALSISSTPLNRHPLSSFQSVVSTPIDYVTSLDQMTSCLSLVPPSASPLAFNNALTLSGDYTYSPQFNASSPERSYTPPDGASMSPPALSYNISNGDLVSEGPSSGRHSRNSSTGSAASVSYAATVPRSHRFNPIGVPANRPTLRTRRRNSKAADEAPVDVAAMDAEEDDDEEFQPPPPSTSQANNDV